MPQGLNQLINSLVSLVQNQIIAKILATNFGDHLA